jgi:DNA (cytosine-5)-methyltransferase 1
MYSVVDLFAGAGGLSLGFQQTRKFEIKVAFEKNKDAQKTYRRNHEKAEILDDVCTADYNAIVNKYGQIDIVIGGPPCQGFSNANRQKNHAISQNNMLVKQYVRAILELNPKAFVMENVGMLKSKVHRFYMDRDDERTVEEYHIPTAETELILLEKEYAFARALEVVQNEQLICRYLWNEKDYLLINVIYKQRNNSKKLKAALAKYKNKLMNLSEVLQEIPDNIDEMLNLNKIVADAIQKYYKGEITDLNVAETFEKTVMIQRMLSKAKEIFDNKIVVEGYSNEGNITAHIQSFAVLDYLECILQSDKNGYVLDKGVLCAADFGAPQKRMRYVIMGIKRDISQKIALPKGHVEADEYATVRDAISDLSDVTPIYNVEEDKGIELEYKDVGISDLAKMLRDREVLYNHIITETRGIALKRFEAIKQGENFHSLDKSMKEDTYTDISRTQNTIYLRLNYEEPSGTVVNVRKSMWIHPEHNRAVSIREAARLQTFPDSFVFEGTKDAQYQQVGNAVPPILAKAIAKKLAKLLAKAEQKGGGENE